MAELPSTQAMITLYAENVAPTSRRKYVAAVRRFVDFAGGDYGASKLTSYIRRLQDEGYSPNTIRRFDLTAIRRFYKVNGLAWPLKAWELPSVGERDVYAPALATEAVAKMITAAKEKKMTAQDAALLALSTVFGLRGVEMTTLRGDDVDLDRRLLFIRTAKHGRERWHLIPDAVIPYLRAGLPRALTPRLVNKAFLRIESAANLPRMAEVGFHAIRRALTRQLVEAGLPEPVIRNFLRWKRSADDMLLTYYSTTVVGADGTFTDPGRHDRAVDEQVFARHPFLKLWEG